jgi:3-oxoadipate enol-lactonase
MTDLHFIDSGDGLPVLWIHGFPLSSEVFRPQQVVEGCRHIFPDLRGFGRSPEPRGALSVDDYADDMLAVLDSLRMDRAVVAGLSMGGYVAFALARKAGARIAALILIDTRETADTAEARGKRTEMIAAVEREGIAPVVRDMLPKLLSPAAPPDMVREVEAIVQTSSKRGVIAALQAMASRPDSSALLPTLKMPSLVLVGSADTITPRTDAERMASALAGATLVVIEGAGHLSNVERPRDFNRAVSAFLHTVPLQGSR